MAEESWEVKENAYIACAPAPSVSLLIDDGSNDDVCPYAAWSWCVAGPVWRCCNDGWVAIDPTGGVFDERRFAKNNGGTATAPWANGNALVFQYLT